MTHAYDEQYLDDAMNNMGEMLDYAASDCGMDMDAFFKMFIASGLAEQFGKGNPGVVSGRSGTELVWEVIDKSGADIELPRLRIEYTRSRPYWCGWIFAYYQWYTGRSFKDILQQLSLEEVDKLYPTLHEAAQQKFVDAAKQIIQRKNAPTRIQIFRKNCGYSQRVLAEKSGVNLRTLQQYEAGAKDINKAAAGSLNSLAKVLGCRVEDLLEY